MFFSWPARLFASVTLSCLLAMSVSPGRLTKDLLEGLDALRGAVLGRTRVRDGIYRGTDHVDRVARAVALREHVAHAGALEHRAHAATRDDAGTVGRRLHVHVGRAMLALHGEVQRVVLERHVDHVL